METCCDCAWASSLLDCTVGSLPANALHANAKLHSATGRVVSPDLAARLCLLLLQVTAQEGHIYLLQLLGGLRLLFYFALFTTDCEALRNIVP